MKKIIPTPQLIDLFKSRPETLIFEGYCRYTDKLTLWQEGESYALSVRIGDSQKTCFATDSMDFVDEVLSELCGNVELCGVDERITEYLRDKYRYVWETHCLLHVWNGQPLTHQITHKIYPISPKYAQAVSDGTPYHAPVEEICKCLELHPSAAIFVDGKPVCWCLCHLEKSLGMLYTLPEYRQQGLALEVITALCNDVISRGDIPYAYIVDTNVPSLSLAAKYNFVSVKRADYFLISKN